VVTIFLAHHGGGQDKREIVHQVRATLESMKQTLNSRQLSAAGKPAGE